MYQVAWQRLLSVYYGVGPISITLIVSVYMLGLGLGALVGGHLAEHVKERVRLYLTVEFLLGCFGLVSLPYLDWLGQRTAGSSYHVTLLWKLAFLCVPTLLMGMTLPIVVKILNGWIRNFLESVGFLYFVNTLGAAAGALVASYGLVSFAGLDACIYAAAGLNFVLCGLIYRIARLPPAGPPDASTSAAARSPGLGRWAYAVVFVTGFLAIGYEIAWFRVIEVLVKASSYAFSTVLAVYLAGIALGSYGMQRWLRRGAIRDRTSLFFVLQFLTGALVVFTVAGYHLATSHTRLALLTRVSFGTVLHPSFTLPTSRETLFLSLDIFFWPMVFVFVPTLLMGASFPLIADLALSREGEEGRTVGTVYFFNTLGNVLGGAVTGFGLLPWLGTERTLLLFAAADLAFGLRAWTLLDRVLTPPRRFAAVAAALGIAAAFFPDRGQLYRTIHQPPGPGYETHFAEGVEGVVVTYRAGERVTNYINGLGHGGRPGWQFHAETVEAMSFKPVVRRVLVIGFGTGATLEAVEKRPDVESVTLVELNHTLMSNLQNIPACRAVLADPRVRLVMDDGRRYLLRTTETFDLILIDPLRSSTAYSNNLYSRQFFELAARRLSPGGVFMAWLDEHQVMPRTLASVFPHLRVYGFFAVCSNAPLRADAEGRARMLAGYPPEDRARIEQVPVRFDADEHGLRPTLAAFQTNEDWRPVCEYYLGLRLGWRGRDPR